MSPHEIVREEFVAFYQAALLDADHRAFRAGLERFSSAARSLCNLEVSTLETELQIAAAQCTQAKVALHGLVMQRARLLLARLKLVGVGCDPLGVRCLPACLPHHRNIAASQPRDGCTGGD